MIIWYSSTVQQKQESILKLIGDALPSDIVVEAMNTPSAVSGFTPLQLAACHNNVKALNNLISYRVDVESCGNLGITPLVVACHHKSEECAIALLCRGKCNPNPSSMSLGIIAQNAALSKKFTIGNGSDESLLLKEERIAAVESVTVGGQSSIFSPAQVVFILRFEFIPIICY